MAKNYKEAPWWWYATVLVVSFVLGLIVAIKENITLPVWAYIVSLVVGIIVAPFVSRPKSVVSEIIVYGAALTQSSLTEYHLVLSLRQRHCHQQPVENVGGTHDSWTPGRQHVFFCLVA
jgi:hypothetical protein